MANEAIIKSSNDIKTKVKYECANSTQTYTLIHTYVRRIRFSFVSKATDSETRYRYTRVYMWWWWATANNYVNEMTLYTNNDFFPVLFDVILFVFFFSFLLSSETFPWLVRGLRIYNYVLFKRMNDHCVVVGDTFIETEMKKKKSKQKDEPAISNQCSSSLYEMMKPDKT